jgi:hypothetical protein
MLAEWIELERRCCPFLEFKIELPAAGASIVLHLSGGEGVKEFLSTALGGTRRLIGAGQMRPKWLEAGNLLP